MVDIPVDPEVSEGVIATIMATENHWNTQDYGRILELWDENEAFPTYIAEEQGQWFVGWDRLRGYLDPPRPNPAIEALRMDFYDIQVKQDRARSRNRDLESLFRDEDDRIQADW